MYKKIVLLSFLLLVSNNFLSSHVSKYGYLDKNFCEVNNSGELTKEVFDKDAIKSNSLTIINNENLYMIFQEIELADYIKKVLDEQPDVSYTIINVNTPEIQKAKIFCINLNNNELWEVLDKVEKILDKQEEEEIKQEKIKEIKELKITKFKQELDSVNYCNIM